MIPIHFEYHAQVFIEKFNLKNLINFEKLETIIRNLPRYAFHMRIYFNIHELIDLLEKSFSDVFKSPEFQFEALNDELIKGFKDDTIYELMKHFKKTKNWDEERPSEEEIQKTSMLQQKLDELIPIFYLIPRIFNREELDKSYDTLVNLGIGHSCISYRNETLALMFSDEYEEIIYPQFKLDILFDFLPSADLINEIRSKHWEDSHLDPAHYVNEVGKLIYKQGTKEQAKRFKDWIEGIADRIEDQEYYKLIKKMSFEWNSFFWDEI